MFEWTCKTLNLPKGLFVPADQGAPVSKLADLLGQVEGRRLRDSLAEVGQGPFNFLFRPLGLCCPLLQELHLLLQLSAFGAGFAFNPLRLDVIEGIIFDGGRLDVSRRCLKRAPQGYAAATATAAHVSPRYPPLLCLMSNPSCPVPLAEVPDERLDVRCRGPIFVIWSATAEPFSCQMLPQALVHGTGGAPR